MSKKKGIVSLILTVAVLVFLAYTAVIGIGPTQTGAAKNIKLGLDLEGGVSITYQVKGDKPSSEDMSDTIYKLQKRVEQYSTEASVYQEGDDRISIEIPGVQNADEVLNELGQPGTLYFIAQTDSEGNQNYSYVSSTGDTGTDWQLNKSIEELEADGSIVLTGNDVKNATAESRTDQDTKKNQSVVSLSFTKDGTEKFAEATKKAYAAGESIGIYYDGAFVSVPNVQSVISDGQAQITGMDSFEEAEQLASTIRIGGLNLQLEELRSNVVGAQLGQEANSTSLMAGAIGLAIVFVFMCIVYLLPGFASGLALLIYTELVVICLNAFDITLTLPGIAGIILGIGMAVDANVIIFARVREEISAGHNVKAALKNGFHKAMSAIVDGNVTTIIAAIVLWWRGSGTVKGFAQTLALGIILSMFTALVITRLIIYAFYAVGIKDQKFYGKVRPERSPINFLAKKKVFFAISIAAMLIGLGFGIFNHSQGKGAMNYSLEFKGGTATTVTFDKEYSLDEIDKDIVPLIEDVTGDKNVQVQKVQNSDQVTFNSMMQEKFGVAETDITSENISSTVSSEMRSDAVTAVIMATICMLLYIWFRFKNIRFAGSAVLALIHDVLIVISFYAIARVSVGNTFIACILTIVGYSINATIVIFDRIREELKRNKKEELSETVNRSITETLTRSIYTTFTTFVMVAVLYILGVSSIREFALPLMVGVAWGAYSSVCITGALWYLMTTRIGKQQTAKQTGKRKK